MKVANVVNGFAQDFNKFVVRARGITVDLTPAGFAELEPWATEAGLCPSGPDQMRVCGAQ